MREKDLMKKKQRNSAVDPKKRMVAEWVGFGIISPKGLFLEAIGQKSEYILKRLEQSAKGSRLVVVTAQLERVSKAEFRKSTKTEFGFTPQWRVVR